MDIETPHAPLFSDEKCLDITGISKLKTLDVGLALLNERLDDEAVSESDSKRICRKVDLHILPLLFLIYTVQWIDKNTLAALSILGFIADNHLTTSEYNTLASAFFIGYLVFQWPQNWALQRYPVGKWLSLNIFLWSLFLSLHAACHNFAGLFVLRFLLGMSEACMNAGLLLVCSMFYTRKEVSERLGWTYQCSGLALIISNFVQFGLAHVPAGHTLSQWQWFSITVGLVTFVTSFLFFLFFPDNPTNAHFLTPEERLISVRRVRENQNGIETKVWKKYQLMEALRDPKTWLHLLFMAFAMLTSGVGVQYILIIKSLGFTQFQTTLLGIPGGLSQIIFISIACYAVRRFPNSRGWISIISWIPTIIACFMGMLLPLGNKIGRLLGMYVYYMGVQPAVVIAMSWAVSNSSGHSKKMATSAVMFIGWAIGNALGPQFWLDKYKPGNRVPWGLVLMASLVSIACTLALRTLFVLENNRRNALKAEAVRTGVGLASFEEYSTVETVDSDGKLRKRQISKMYLDLTDGENLAFRYVL